MGPAPSKHPKHLSHPKSTKQELVTTNIDPSNRGCLQRKSPPTNTRLLPVTPLYSSRPQTVSTPNPNPEKIYDHPSKPLQDNATNPHAKPPPPPQPNHHYRHNTTQTEISNENHQQPSQERPTNTETTNTKQRSRKITDTQWPRRGSATKSYKTTKLIRKGSYTPTGAHHNHRHEQSQPPRSLRQQTIRKFVEGGLIVAERDATTHAISEIRTTVT